MTVVQNHSRQIDAWLAQISLEVAAAGKTHKTFMFGDYLTLVRGMVDGRGQAALLVKAICTHYLDSDALLKCYRATLVTQRGRDALDRSIGEPS